MTCLDASEAMVKICQDKGLHALQGDLLNLPFAQESFAGAWAYTSLLHVPKHDFPKARQEIFRVLQPGGVLGLGLIEGDTEEYRTSEKVPAPRLFSYFTMNEVLKHLENTDFSIIFQEQFQPNRRKYLHVIAKKK
jgi:ubiquinone/menaquinone biosynthesis C-methylase UbiE